MIYIDIHKHEVKGKNLVFSVVLILVFTIASEALQKKASLNHTFAYKRAELITVFINAITLEIDAIDYITIQPEFKKIKPKDFIV